jgi:heme/copper-type cytochrome/quinol oxidase subunit 2
MKELLVLILSLIYFTIMVVVPACLILVMWRYRKMHKQ